MQRFLVIALLLIKVPLLAQYIEFGTGASFTKFQGQVYSKKYNGYYPIDSTSEPQLCFDAVISGNIPLRYIKDELVFGVNPNASLALFYSTIAIDVPVFATLKFGSGSSENSESVLGAGIGAGAQFSFMSTALPAGSDYINYSGFMVFPVITGEASITFQNYNMYQLRLEFTPVPISRFQKYGLQGNISQVNIRLIRAFF